MMDEVAWTVAADKAGFKYTWATEHHFLTEYSHLSASESFIPYTFPLTERIHVGSGIWPLNPAQNHPVRLAERACQLRGEKEPRYWGTLDAAYAETGTNLYALCRSL